MKPVDHTHPVNAQAVSTARSAVLPPQEAEQLSRLLAVLAEPARSRMLFALVAVDELCVGDMVMSLAISMDQASYGLKLVRGARCR